MKTGATSHLYISPGHREQIICFRHTDKSGQQIQEEKGRCLQPAPDKESTRHPRIKNHSALLSSNRRRPKNVEREGAGASAAEASSSCPVKIQRREPLPGSRDGGTRAPVPKDPGRAYRDRSRCDTHGRARALVH